MIDPRLFVIPADPSNQEGAALTAAATRMALPRNSNVQLVIETERNRNDFSASFFPQLQEDWTKVSIADSGFKAAVYDALTAQGLPVPFYPTLDPNKGPLGLQRYNEQRVACRLHSGIRANNRWTLARCRIQGGSGN